MTAVGTAPAMGEAAPHASGAAGAMRGSAPQALGAARVMGEAAPQARGTDPTPPSRSRPAAGPYAVTPLRTLLRRRIAWSFRHRPGPLGTGGRPLPGSPSLGPLGPSAHQEL
jgi:hypothetical protein